MIVLLFQGKKYITRKENNAKVVVLVNWILSRVSATTLTEQH